MTAAASLVDLALAATAVEQALQRFVDSTHYVPDDEAGSRLTVVGYTE